LGEALSFHPRRSKAAPVATASTATERGESAATAMRNGLNLIAAAVAATGLRCGRGRNRQSGDACREE
jgi:hypothetical protein